MNLSNKHIKCIQSSELPLYLQRYNITQEHNELTYKRPKCKKVDDRFGLLPLSPHSNIFKLYIVLWIFNAERSVNLMSTIVIFEFLNADMSFNAQRENMALDYNNTQLYHIYVHHRGYKETQTLRQPSRDRGL